MRTYLLYQVTCCALPTRSQAMIWIDSFIFQETALVLVQNDILKALDRRHGVILILLDMSAAFDTVEHMFWTLELL